MVSTKDNSGPGCRFVYRKLLSYFFLLDIPWHKQCYTLEKSWSAYIWLGQASTSIILTSFWFTHISLVCDTLKQRLHSIDISILYRLNYLRLYFFHLKDNKPPRFQNVVSKLTFYSTGRFFLSRAKAIFIFKQTKISTTIRAVSVSCSICARRHLYFRWQSQASCPHENETDFRWPPRSLASLYPARMKWPQKLLSK